MNDEHEACHGHTWPQVAANLGGIFLVMAGVWLALCLPEAF